MAGVHLNEIIDRGFLERMLRSFSLATGLGAEIVDRNGVPVIQSPVGNSSRFCRLIRSTEEGNQLCLTSFREGGEQANMLGEPYIFRCHAGLIEWVAPITIDGNHIASITCGQVLMWKLDEIAWEELLSRTESLAVDREALLDAAKELQIVSGPRVQAAADLLFAVANQVMQSSSTTLKQRRELHHHQARLAEVIHERKQLEETLEKLQGRTSQSAYPFEKERELLGAVRFGERVRAKEILNDILGNILFVNAGNPEVVKARIIELLIMLSRAAVEAGASLQTLLTLNCHHLQEIQNIDPIEELCAWIVRVLDQFLDVIYETRNITTAKPLQQAIEYINDHHAEDLSLEVVAHAVQISPFYLSHLFSNELGITFLNYLTKVRIEKAKTLLLTTNMTVQEIAYAVGYNDPSYFTKVFKKLEGRTPTQYKG